MLRGDETATGKKSSESSLSPPIRKDAFTRMTNAAYFGQIETDQRTPSNHDSRC